MKQELVYIGTKIVRGVEMSISEFKAARQESYSGEDAPGYRVTYEDGYISWSPKDIFERCYRVINNSELSLIK